MLSPSAATNRRLGRMTLTNGGSRKERARARHKFCSSAFRRHSAATGPATRGASVTVLADRDAPAIQQRGIEIADVGGCAKAHRQVEHLVEIAIVERPIPADGERV